KKRKGDEAGSVGLSGEPPGQRRSRVRVSLAAPLWPYRRGKSGDRSVVNRRRDAQRLAETGHGPAQHLEFRGSTAFDVEQETRLYRGGKRRDPREDPRLLIRGEIHPMRPRYRADLVG